MSVEHLPKERLSLREHLCSSRALLGLLQLHANPSLAATVSEAGFDFLFLDGEHGQFRDNECLETLRALRGSSVIAMVRLPDREADSLYRYVAMGADAIVVPHVSTPEHALDLARAMQSAIASTRTAQDRASLIVIIESALGVSNADAILSIDGVDGVFVGPSDLTADLGCRGDYAQTSYRDSLGHIERAAAAAGKFLGTAPHGDYTIDTLIGRGHRMLVIGSDVSLIGEAMRARVNEARSSIAGAAARRKGPKTLPSDEEPVLEPELPIVDAHHHLWFVPEARWRPMESDDNITTQALGTIFRHRPRYLFDEFQADLDSGHNVRATVFVGAATMYRATGPEPMKAVGEIEFVNGTAAMAASGLFGDVKVCAGIVGSADLMLGDAVEEVLRAHLQAGGSRYRGIRGAGLPYDEDGRIIAAGGAPHRLLDTKFREGFKWLHRLGLSFDVLVLEPQLADLIDLARAFPETQIILNHVGAPVGVGRYAGRREQRFSVWKENMRGLAQSGNVAVKLGGLGGSPFGGFKSFMSTPPASSAQLAAEWRPYIETCIELFGADRCMFESNFPVDAATCSYRVLWNAFKQLAAGASTREKAALFGGTAARVYRIEP